MNPVDSRVTLVCGGLACLLIYLLLGNDRPTALSLMQFLDAVRPLRVLYQLFNVVLLVGLTPSCL